MKFDYDDETTWPDDPDELAKLADGIPDDGEDEATSETPAADADNNEDGESEQEQQTDDGEQQADDTPLLTIDGISILTKDGKHVIPHDVLSTERKRRQAAEAELKELKSRSTGDTGTQPATADDASKAPATTDEIPADVMRRVEEARENWGDTVADQILEGYKLKVQFESQAKIIDELKTSLKRSADEKKAEEDRMVRDAIDNSPALAAWEALEDPKWFDRAAKFHDTLMAMDESYAAMSWHDRFQALPVKLKGVFPDAPLPTAQNQSTADVQKKASNALAAAKQAASKPKSMTDITSGETEVNESPLDDLIAMDSVKLQAKMDKLAEDPEKLDAFLRQFSLD